MGRLHINGITLPVKHKSFSEDTPEKVGEQARAKSGALRESVIAVKRRYSGELVPKTIETARAFKQLLLGDGHVWTFDSSLYSKKGLVPEAGYDATQSGAGGWDGGKLTLTDTTGIIEFLTALPSRWSVMFRIFDAGAWHHHLYRASGDRYVDGVVVPGAWPTDAPAVDPGTGKLTLQNTSGADVDYDELVALPYEVPADWIAQLAANTLPFGGPPTGLRAGGELVAYTPEFGAADTLLVHAEVGELPQERAGSSLVGSLRFQLMEV